MTHHIRTVVLGLVALLGVLLVGGAAPAAGAAAAAAAAAPCVYVPTCTPTLSVVAPTTAAGSTQTLVGSGFAPGDRVTVTVTLADGSKLVLTAVADANGSFTLTFTVPGDLGLATLVAVGERSGTASTTMIVVSGGVSGSGGPTVTDGGGAGGSGDGGSSGGGSTDGGGLAFTGVAVAATGSVALLLVLAGGILLVLGRRPRRHASGEH